MISHDAGTVASQSDFPAAFVIVGLAMVGLAFPAILAFGGWRDLAARYPAGKRPREGIQVWAASVDLGFMTHYNQCINLSIGGEGLRMAVWLPLRFLHPPVFIPWSAVAECEVRDLWFLRRTLVHLRDTPLHFRIRGRAAPRVVAAWQAASATAATAPDARRLKALPGATHPEVPEPLSGERFPGARAVVFLSALSSVLLVVSAVTGIASIATGPDGAIITRHAGGGRFLSLGLAAVSAGFAYGVHTRARLAWRAGFVLLGLSYAHVLWISWSAGIPAVPLMMATLGGAAMTLYWGAWWHRQRSYFR